MRRHLYRVAVLFLCILSIGALTVLRFQRVRIQYASPPQTNNYWRVLLPGQTNCVNLIRDGWFNTEEYNMRGLYGLLKVDRSGGARLPWKAVPPLAPLGLDDPSIEAAEHINLEQMQRTRSGWDTLK